MARRSTTGGPNGFVVVDKPSGWTSHDVVAKSRGIHGTRKVGHSGTLDPMATGVLVLGVGSGTKLLRFMSGLDKTYEARIHFGVETDTLDAEGRVVARHDMPAPTAQEVQRGADRLTGDLMQVPPMVSALKVGGRRLHELAREGKEVHREPRPVTVGRFSTSPTRDSMEFSALIDCSAGTYVRSLARDLGPALGTVAHLDALRREAAGPFTLADAHALAAIEETAARGEIAAILLPTGARLGLPVLRLDPATATRIGHGQQVALDAVPSGSMSDDQAWSEGGLAAAHDDGGDFLGVMRCLHRQDEGRWVWKAEKWLA